jgi:uncharacterized repeat protein (TIGR04076 family)
MLTVNLRIGIAEIALAISLVLVLALVALFVIEWPIGLIPAASYAVATVGTYAGYRVHSREQVHARLAELGSESVKFRVVHTMGTCPLGHSTGDVIAVSASGSVEPVVCPEAAAMLQMAARDGHVARWCCPVYDHMLIFRKEAVAA